MDAPGLIAGSGAARDAAVHQGGCACGAVRFTADGQPRRVGLCHCMTCRKAHGAAFNPFVVYAADQVEILGEPGRWTSSPGYDRLFCAQCGSRIAGLNGEEIELSIGGFDEVGMFAPTYENWVRRREPWLPDMGLEQRDTQPAPVDA